MEVPPEDLERALLVVCRSLYNYWRKKKGRNHQDTMDLVQAGALKCTMKANKWDGKSRLTTFLVRVGINAGNDELRKEARYRRLKQALSDEG